MAAIVGDERLTLGRFRRGALSIAYLLAAPVIADTITVDDFVTRFLADTSSPFAHLAD